MVPKSAAVSLVLGAATYAYLRFLEGIDTWAAAKAALVVVAVHGMANLAICGQQQQQQQQDGPTLKGAVPPVPEETPAAPPAARRIQPLSPVDEESDE